AIAYGARASRVYDWVLSRILSTELPPGSFIDKAAIAAAVGVSKQPVTVALARLAREGWVEIESRVGSYVARVDPAALREIGF
ncbi:GntR family transcriptional regulator, partial [Mycobacterium tuberculosis]|nr:GntR family transcriptional regulator [Mycobacterium tuberculosis]